MPHADPFWQRKSLADMTTAEWEALCDGCGKCCLHKLEDEQTGDIFYTDVACRLLDTQSCRCTNYAQRVEYVTECMQLSPRDASEFHWLPDTCAYRLLAEGKPLPEWHYLVCGSHGPMHREGHSVRGRVVEESEVSEDDLEEHIVQWVTL